MKLFAVFVHLLFLPFFHADHIAEYTYQLSDTHLNLKFVIDRSEVAHFNFNSDCNIKEMTALCLSKYINEKSRIEINGKRIALALQNAHTEKDHLIINLTGKVKTTSIETLSITNTCFYEFNAKFKNRILLDIGKFQKSYLLTSKKSTIHLK